MSFVAVPLQHLTCQVLVSGPQTWRRLTTQILAASLHSVVWLGSGLYADTVVFGLR